MRKMRAAQRKRGWYKNEKEGKREERAVVSGVQVDEDYSKRY